MSWQIQMNFVWPWLFLVIILVATCLYCNYSVIWGLVHWIKAVLSRLMIWIFVESWLQYSICVKDVKISTLNNTCVVMTNLLKICLVMTEVFDVCLMQLFIVVLISSLDKSCLVMKNQISNECVSRKTGISLV